LVGARPQPESDAVAVQTVAEPALTRPTVAVGSLVPVTVFDFPVTSLPAAGEVISTGGGNS